MDDYGVNEVIAFKFLVSSGIKGVDTMKLNLF
jgi:hypothetical protein